ncbi:hypothetical protein V1477_016953 [Vespula maculifrons]|uniref:Uncharacterized protein n=1 Tax=Vespula maculifrons TaxID=7453 RepID=A0ABD2B4L6_VESMC
MSDFISGKVDRKIKGALINYARIMEFPIRDGGTPYSQTQDDTYIITLSRDVRGTKTTLAVSRSYPARVLAQRPWQCPHISTHRTIATFANATLLTHALTRICQEAVASQDRYHRGRAHQGLSPSSTSNPTLRTQNCRSGCPAESNTYLFSREGKRNLGFINCSGLL